MSPSPLPPSAQTPERRSAADLQKILDSLIGDKGAVLSGDLPDVLAKYEQDNDLIILDPSEYDGLRELCQAHADMELGPTELFAFLSMIQKPAPAVRPISPSPATISHPSSLPRRSTPSSPSKHSHRRRSDRVRSPSDSSSSSSDDEAVREAVRRRHDRQASSPFEGQAFPISNSTPPIAVGLHPHRKKTVSDPSRHPSSVISRAIKNGVPPSAFNGNGGFARPSPASRRRRGSSGMYGSDSEDPKSLSYGQSRFHRSTSSQTYARSVSSPTSSSGPMSPTSTGIDDTSFHGAKSPEEMGYEDAEAADLIIDEGDVEDNEHDPEVEEADDVVGQGMLSAGGDALNPRLSRISTESTTSLRTSHDKLQVLQKHNTELGRKLKESERQLELLGADNDRMVNDLERELEEARYELAQKRKEDKELRGHELKQNIQISGLEADLANVQRLLEQSKEHRANMQKMYDSQCDEAQRLRDLLRDRDEEIHKLEEALQDHEADEEKYTREVQSLEAEIKRLESDLVLARRAETVLETQKHENLQLKETIDRMRFDLDEARAARSNKGSQGRSSANASAAGTLSRNLGDEITRKLGNVETAHTEVEHEEEDGDSIVETIVTTQRRRKVGARTVSEPNPNVPLIRLEELREYADASTLTEPVDVRPVATISEAGPSSSSMPQEHPPAYTAKPAPINEQEVLDRAHPRRLGHSYDELAQEEYGMLSETLGLRCTVLEEEIKTKMAEQHKLGLAPRRRRSLFTARKAGSTESLVQHIVLNTQDAITHAIHMHSGKATMWLAAAFAVGVVAGTHFVQPSGIHPRDYQLWDTFNDLARATGAGEGFMPGSFAFAGMVGSNMLSRVPT